MKFLIADYDNCTGNCGIIFWVYGIEWLGYRVLPNSNSKTWLRLFIVCLYTIILLYLSEFVF